MDPGLTGSNKSIRTWLLANWLGLVAGSAILVLAIVGSICAWKVPHPFAFENRFYALAITWGPAAIYALGYFRTFPEVLRAGLDEHEGSLAQRWSNLVRMSSAVAIFFTLLCWASIATKHFGIVMTIPLNQPDQSPHFINMFILGTLSAAPITCIICACLAAALMMICAVASEQLLVGKLGALPASSETNRNSVISRIVGGCGEWLARRLRPRLTVAAGAVLLLLSLIAPMDPFGGFGLDVVTGKQNWPTADYTLAGPALIILSQAARFMYIAALAVALLSLATLVMRDHGARLRKGIVLVSISTVIAIFAVCDLTLGVARLDPRVPPVLNLIVFAVVWILPIFVWMKRAYAGTVHSNRTRIAVMLLYLPLVFAGLALFPLALVFIPGYACFLLGTGLLTLAFLRSRGEVTVQPIPIESESKIFQAA